MNPVHLLRYVIAETLLALSPQEPRMDSPVARALLLGTAMVESDLQHLQQRGGPAMGLWQIEPATHEDCWTNWLSFRPDMHSAYRALCVFEPSPEEMRWNLVYACAMARLVYWRDREPLPGMDAMALARTHKRVYNTALGATDVNESVGHFRKAIRYVEPVVI